MQYKALELGKRPDKVAYICDAEVAYICDASTLSKGWESEETDRSHKKDLASKQDEYQRDLRGDKMT